MRRPRFTSRFLFFLIAIVAAFFAFRVLPLRKLTLAKNEIERDRVGMLVRESNAKSTTPKLRSFIALAFLGHQGVDRVRGVWIRECDRKRYNPEHTPYDDKTVIPLIKHMNSLPDMKELSLFGTSVTSKTISYVGDLRFLETLNISMTNVDDSAIPDILKLRRLKNLDAGGSKITTEGLETLTEGLPGCEIH